MINDLMKNCSCVKHYKNWVKFQDKKPPDEDLICSRYNMAGYEITNNGKILPNGRVFFGANFILKSARGYDFIIQQTKSGKLQTIELKAKSDRSARIEINKLYPGLRNSYHKPRFVDFSTWNAENMKRDATKKEENEQ